MLNFNNKTVLVTGGSRGIGYAIATMFAKQGANVVINYYSSSTNVEELLNEFKKYPGKVTAVQGDVSVFEDCERIVNFVTETFGGIDILINNAGITKDTLMMRMSNDDFDSVIQTNLNSTFYLSKLVMRPMMKKGFGRIINISSVVALIGNAGQTNYVASKAAVIGLTKSLAKEIGSKGVTVNAIAPGFIETDMTKSLPEEVVNNYMSSIPLRKFGKPEDIANACLFLAGDMADYITAQVLSVNGGMA